MNAAVKYSDSGAIRCNQTSNFHFLSTKIATTFTTLNRCNNKIQGLKVLA